MNSNDGSEGKENHEYLPPPPFLVEPTNNNNNNNNNLSSTSPAAIAGTGVDLEVGIGAEVGTVGSDIAVDASTPPALVSGGVNGSSDPNNNNTTTSNTTTTTTTTTTNNNNNTNNNTNSQNDHDNKSPPTKSPLRARIVMLLSTCMSGWGMFYMGIFIVIPLFFVSLAVSVVLGTIIGLLTYPAYAVRRLYQREYPWPDAVTSFGKR